MTISRIAILDDDPAIREHLTEIITSCPDYDLAGTAPTIARARDLVVRKRPDLVLVDVGLPDEWMESPALFLFQTYDRKKDMLLS